MAKLSDLEYFAGISYADKCDILTQILSTTTEDILNTIPVFEKVNKDDDVCVIGNKEAIEKCKDQLDEIYNF